MVLLSASMTAQLWLNNPRRNKAQTDADISSNGVLSATFLRQWMDIWSLMLETSLLADSGCFATCGQSKQYDSERIGCSSSSDSG